MTTPAPASVAPARSALQLTRGVSATWWYTASGILFFDAVLVLVWMSALLVSDRGTVAVLVSGIGGACWVLAQMPVLLAYRNRPGVLEWRRVLLPILVAVAYGAAGGLASGMWIAAAFPLMQILVLLSWGPGIRRRILLAATLLLVALWIIDVRADPLSDEGVSGWLVGFYSIFLPWMSVLSLWWWDVLVSLDRARASEARLGATQERLRVATDVHDLQGHHLQVIALQLELAERLMASDPEAALAQLRAARTSVDEARQGTRDLATRFRSVPLGDEVANAVDLLRAAGVSAEASVHPSADLAPADVLGPVVRETTTNVLRHGGGRWARLSLHPEAGAWRFAIENDAEAAADDDGGGAGLEGVGRRVAEADGTLDVQRGSKSFAVTVTVPVSGDAR
ncbi:MULTISPECIES: sensor histidine kinase [unclassified Rathayibacter]|uniref:sensor histidine kinase n=1 Tax=unclassified Rathayibacter TaxID=2609250 RepID=UPI0006F92B6D|nr:MULTISPECIES: histidine kinase [unclassified Rathayibacter]KQQ05488.1 histidine kinase [Rathayibacter sp. Leaf294]KQS13351.1 histidine kinase [Rathayibacter sp. Leaf185]